MSADRYCVDSVSAWFHVNDERRSGAGSIVVAGVCDTPAEAVSAMSSPAAKRRRGVMDFLQRFGDETLGLWPRESPQVRERDGARKYDSLRT